MDSVNILRALWGRRLQVFAVALVAIAVGWALAYRPSLPPKPRSYTVGVATASVLVDTPKSQVVEVDPKGSDTLGARANVLANLMVDGEIKDAIAHRAGIAPTRLISNTESRDDATPPPPLTARSLSYTTSVALTSDMAQLPIIRVQTQAPTVGQAIRLANAAVAGFGDYLDTRAADETVSDTRRLRVRALGTAQGHVAARGPSRIVAAGAAVFVFLFGCAGILALASLIRGWRAAIASEPDAAGREPVAVAVPADEAPEQQPWPRQSEPATKLRA